MKLIFSGYDKAPELMVSDSKLLDCPWAKKGCFKYHYRWEQTPEALIVKFHCNIMIVSTLTGVELSKVRQHEQKHFGDFRQVAENLRGSIQKTMSSGKPLDMDNRLEWFDWDVNESSNQYHKRLGMHPTVKIGPISPRPNP